jgi:predicted metal-dependent hydrolase
MYQRGSRIHVDSKNDGKRYLVKNNKFSSNSANILAELNNKKLKLCTFLKAQDKYKNHNGVQNLLNNSDVVIEEVAKKYEKEAAYSINKGEKIGICLRDKTTGKLQNINDMFFVLIHELAHIMTDEYKHNKKFWDNMSLLLENAIKAGLYKYTNYKHNPTNFCGHLISHTPYSK